MIFRFNILLMMMVAFVLRANASPSFYVKSLEDIHHIIGINLPDNLGRQVENDSTWKYSGKTLRVCTNRNGDISHIGYKLFDTEFVQSYPLRSIFNFLERYALEIDLHRQHGYKLVDENQFHIKFIKGDLNMLKKIKPEHPLNVEEKKGKGFVITCGSQSHPVVVAIPADYQLLWGCNAIELENIFERDLNRVSPQLISNVLPERWKDGKMFSADHLTVVSKGCFLNEMIKSDLYLSKKNGKYYVSRNKNNQLHYITNILLTGCAEKILPLSLTINKYGNTKKKMSTTYQQYVQYCLDEGCELYVGIKKVTDEQVSVTLFACNSRMAYNHMLSLEVPLSLLETGKGSLEGQLYAYTPLQNVVKDLYINP